MKLRNENQTQGLFLLVKERKFTRKKVLPLGYPFVLVTRCSWKIQLQTIKNLFPFVAYNGVSIHVNKIRLQLAIVLLAWAQNRARQV